MIRLGYLGPQATYTHLAANSYSEKVGTKVSLAFSRSIVDLFYGLNNGDYDQIIVPIENSIEGAVSVTLDMMVKTESVFMNHEVTLPINHCLLASNLIDLNDVEMIYTHSQPFSQCQFFINEYFNDVNYMLVDSTANAAELCKKNQLSVAIGGEQLATEYGLHILKKNINDFTNNVTRFVVVSKKHSKTLTANKVSIVFSTPKDEPGSLQKVLQIFSDNNLNLTRIESRPSKSELGEYLFFVDFVFSGDYKFIEKIIESLKDKTYYFKQLGAF